MTQLALGSSFTCVLLETEEVKCWGDDQHGRLGSGSVADPGSHQVPADIKPIRLGEGAIQIAAGEQHACAVLVDGGVRGWGRNSDGQVGLPGEAMVGDDELPSDLPLVDVGATVEMIAAGNDHTCAILSDGEVRCWGRDSFDHLGTPDSTNIIGDDETPSVSPVVILVAAAVMIDAHYDHTCVVYAQGEVQCWGSGGAGRLGYGNTEAVGDDEDVSLVDPIVLGGGVPTHLATGMAHTCVRLETTEVYCWGKGITVGSDTGTPMTSLLRRRCKSRSTWPSRRGWSPVVRRFRVPEPRVVKSSAGEATIEGNSAMERRGRPI